ncbi:SDR family oxidoreductase [Bacillus sp. 165]|uniref:SDR family NAD(P)-dependent oxidoreductase n=1 Tax=Bacillus sp. 165 TaxID=1529117 RepID=UPI001ADB997D|nr:SDR family oxidoreductase [Bacillus sp. 165]MBO9131044.1 SDR family oxidoreductase [Bacillus sp. 165]
MRLQNKVAIVTGGSGGIGLATVKRLASEGAKVVIADINEEGGQKAVEEVSRELGSEVLFIKTNVASYEAVVHLVERTVEEFGRLDIMFNNAGFAKAAPLLQHNPVEDFDPIVAVNQNGVYYGILAAARKMVELGIKGTIINTASVFGILPGELTFTYNATKAAVINMTSSAAMELAPNGIRVVAIAPGRVNTPILSPYKDFGVWDQMVSEQMRGTLTEPMEIANAVAFLASEEANCINGTCVNLDDGYSSFKARLFV